MTISYLSTERNHTAPNETVPVLADPETRRSNSPFGDTLYAELTDADQPLGKKKALFGLRRIAGE